MGVPDGYFRNVSCTQKLNIYVFIKMEVNCLNEDDSNKVMTVAMRV